MHIGGPVNARLFENQQEAMVFVYISVVPYLHAPFKKVERPSTPLHTCEGLILPLQGARTSTLLLEGCRWPLCIGEGW